mmetsp:Transcript_30603/g.58976  ORF Transcript_30603/g.58976 Transcript_30603/m.58976 type:complete len:230 (+) Transcript_30603:793-1482(+)
MSEAHETHTILLRLDLAHKLRHLVLGANLSQHSDHSLVGAAVRGAPQGSHSSRNACVRVGLGGSGDAHGGGGGVLLVVRMQNQKHVHRLLEHVVNGLRSLAGELGVHGVRKHHVHQVLGVRVLRLGDHVGQAQVVPVHHGGDHGHLGDQARGCQQVLFLVLGLEFHGVEGGQSSDHGSHLGHGVCIGGEVLKETHEIFFQQHVLVHLLHKVFVLLGRRKLAVQQKVASL